MANLGSYLFIFAHNIRPQLLPTNKKEDDFANILFFILLATPNMDRPPEMALLHPSAGDIFRLNSGTFESQPDNLTGRRHDMIKEMDFFSENHTGRRGKAVRLSSQDHDSKDGSMKIDAGISVSN